MYMRLRNVSLMMAIVFSVSLLPGCATMDQNQRLVTERATTSAFLGTAAGLATALLTGDVAAGVAVGLAASALTWHAVKAIQPEEQQVRTAAEDRRLYGFAPATNQIMIKLNKGEANPKVISPGQETIITSDYSLSVPASYNNQAEVTYLWKLKKDGKVVVESDPAKQVKVAAGHQTRQPIKVPAEAEKGTYVVETLLASGKAYDVNETVFVVK